MEKRVFKYCRLVLGHEHDAEDVTQDVLIRGIELLRSGRYAIGIQVDGINGFPNVWWVIHQTAEFLLMNFERKRRRMQKAISLGANCRTDEGHDSIYDQTRSKDVVRSEILERREQESVVREEIERLPQRQREMLVGQYYRYESHKEIAERLGVSVATVTTAIHHARANLREALAKYALNEREVSRERTAR